MPGRGGLGGDSGTPGGTTNGTPDSGYAGRGEQLASSSLPSVSLLSAGTSGGTGGEMPGGGGAPADMPQGGIPDFSQSGDNGGTPQSDLPQGGWDFGGRQGGGNMRNPNGVMPGQENAPQTAETGTPVTAEELILTGVSAVALLIGCAVAAGYKRRG